MVVSTDPLEFAIFQMRFSRKRNFMFCSTYAPIKYTQRNIEIRQAFGLGLVVFELFNILKNHPQIL